MTEKCLTEIVDSKEIAAGIAFNETLNPVLWDGDDLKLEVRIALLKSALAFIKFLDLDEFQMTDVILTGSNASYNYTKFSDCDVHLVSDFTETAFPDIAANFFTTKKTLWNETHDALIHDYPVELYVQDVGEPLQASGIYSILKGEWVVHPTRNKPKWNDSAVEAKTNGLADEIDEIVSTSADKPIIDKMFLKLKALRKSGLEKNGEFSVENLAFKALRNLGYIGRLADARRAAEDRDLSV